MTHMVHFTPLMSVCRHPRDPLEAREELLHDSIHRIGGWLHDNLAASCGNVEVEEVFHRRQVRSLDSFTKAVLSGHGFTGTREPFLSKVSLHFAEIPSSEPTSELTSLLAGWSRGARTARSGSTLRFDPSCLIDVHVTVPDLVLLFVFSSFVTVCFGLSQQVVRGNGSSYHDGEGR